jgi:hypothetical protein
MSDYYDALFLNMKELTNKNSIKTMMLLYMRNTREKTIKTDRRKLLLDGLKLIGIS